MLRKNIFNIYNSYRYIVFQKMSKYLIVKRARLNSEDLIFIYFENLVVICFEHIIVQICFVIEKNEFFGCRLLEIQKKISS